MNLISGVLVEKRSKNVYFIPIPIRYQDMCKNLKVMHVSTI